jgi:uncharacterized cysteine cluster protein YcgN (CxxCxxCC family)
MTNATAEKERFWETKSLEEMNRDEWELLCDGCGRCCLHKIEDVETGLVYYTSVACRLLDSETCRCTSYCDRVQQVPDCLVLTPQTVLEYVWLPKTCAYRLLAQGKRLKKWHHLISGDIETVHHAYISVRGRIINEKYIDHDQLEAYIIDCNI